jgi:hypothetical protein
MGKIFPEDLWLGRIPGAWKNPPSDCRPAAEVRLNFELGLNKG